MIYITQLIYIKEGQESTFHRFEDVAIPIIAKYNGQLLLRLRPSAKEVIASSMKVPYEIHLVSFDTHDDFENFKQDKERLKFLHLKEQSIESSLMITGAAI